MSWFAQGLAEDGEVSVDTNGDQWSDEMSAQISAASRAVQAVVKSGALGDPQAKYNVALSGHANPDHTPVAGWANDFVSITITQTGEV